jgi:adenosylcobinamide kinase/adenosylcobinamide-phosphate guanylyltransferase
MKNLSFVVGGAASGKSAFAERLTRATGKPKIYIATLQPFDDEMREKVRRHRSDRGPDWTTVEAPLDLGPVLRDATADQVILIDCVTLWLTNVLLADRNIAEEVTSLLTDIAASACDIVVVSNEVGMGIVPDNALSRRFRNEQGRLNQLLAEQADTVVTVIAGLPLVLKGPCDLAAQTGQP